MPKELMRYFKSETILDWVRNKGLPGFSYDPLKDFREWEQICALKAGAICEVTGCTCVNIFKANFAAGILKQRELAYNGQFIGCATFEEFRKKVVIDEGFIEWEKRFMRECAEQKRCHATRKGFSCYCDETDHACPHEDIPQLVQRER